MAVAPSLVAETAESSPRNEPIGVRAAPTIATSRMCAPLMTRTAENRWLDIPWNSAVSKSFLGRSGKTGHRQGDRETGAPVHRGARLDRAAVLLDDPAGDSQPEPCPGLPLGREERLPDAREIVGADADPVVLDLDDRAVAVAPHAQADAAALARG